MSEVPEHFVSCWSAHTFRCAGSGAAELDPPPWFQASSCSWQNFVRISCGGLVRPCVWSHDGFKHEPPFTSGASVSRIKHGTSPVLGSIWSFCGKHWLPSDALRRLMIVFTAGR